MKHQKLTKFSLADSDMQQLETASEHVEASWQLIAAITEKYVDAQDALRNERKPYAPRPIVYREIAWSAMLGRASVRQYHGMIYGQRDGLGETLVQEYRQFGISHWRIFRPEAKRRIGAKQRGESAEDYRQRLETECESIAEHWAQVAAKRGTISVSVDEVKQEYKPTKAKDKTPVWIKDLQIAAECLATVYQNLPSDFDAKGRAEILQAGQIASRQAEKAEANQ